ncbi:unnamed protein product [Penicillium glandicola]
MADRWTQRGKRPVRIANCSGSIADPGYQMQRQLVRGEVDFVTGDYLAELNLAQNAEAFQSGQHEGFEPTAWSGLQQSIDDIARLRSKVIINGGALNPLGLAQKVQELITEKGYSLIVAAIQGDDVLDQARRQLAEEGKFNYLDPENADPLLHAYQDQQRYPLVGANAYLGARGIVQALGAGADIVICGRVADASPVLAAAQYWYGWPDTAYDELAGALMAGHLIECSAYVTGANFAGFDRYPWETFYDLPFGIAEIDQDGTAVIAKPDHTSGMVTVDTVRSQLLYELQGDMYLNSDVKAYLADVRVEQEAENRVRLSGIRGAPPPSTTKLAIAYRMGYQAQLLFNLGGYAVTEKVEYHKKQILRVLEERPIYSLTNGNSVGTAAPNPSTLLASTVYFRLFIRAESALAIQGLLQAFFDFGMQHVSGGHGSPDIRGALPRPYLGYFPALYPQAKLNEKALILDSSGNIARELPAGHPAVYSPVEPRANNDPEDTDPVTPFDSLTTIPLGDIVLARSGDKGANVNIGLFVSTPEIFSWFRAFMTRAKLQALMGDDWREEYRIERVEFPNILAVHFVVYGFLGWGASSTNRLDCLGKGFADWIRARLVDVPVRFLK